MRFFIIIALFIGLSSLSLQAQSPKKVATNFVKHLLALEFDEAAKLGTASTQSLVNTMKEMLAKSGNPELFKKALVKEIDPKKLKISCTTTGEGNTAECTVCCNQYSESASKPMLMVKQGKTWLVDVKKEQ